MHAPRADRRWSDAVLAATLFALDPVGSGGLSLRAPCGPARDRFLDILRDRLSPGVTLRKMPAGIGEDRLLGGLDLAATLVGGRPVLQRGLLAQADGGVVVVAMAERLPASTAAHICAALDTGTLRVERDGFGASLASRFGVIACDEGLAEERPPASLLDRLAFQVDLVDVAAVPSPGGTVPSPPIASRPAAVIVHPAQVQALCEAASALGIDSLRAPILALRVARAGAALAGRSHMIDDDLEAAARLVLAPRATRLPTTAEAERGEGFDETVEAPGGAPAPTPATGARMDAGERGDVTNPGSAGDAEADGDDAPSSLSETIVGAARSAIPLDLLATLDMHDAGPMRAGAQGRAGGVRIASGRGRPAGVRAGKPAGRERLDVLATLRAAAPWQRLRQFEALSRSEASPPARPRLAIRGDDFRVTRFRHRAETTTIFVVDASGSSALHRLAEAKGAVESLLADSYVRRDHVALIVFRGRSAEVVLPPTRSLARVKRRLAGMPGGGGTPLAAGIEAGMSLAASVRARGGSPGIVILSDGRGNVARDGRAGRAHAAADAIAAARVLRAARIATILVDTSPSPSGTAQQLAAAMNASYVQLPHADSGALARAARAAMPH